MLEGGLGVAEVSLRSPVPGSPTKLPAMPTQEAEATMGGILASMSQWNPLEWVRQGAGLAMPAHLES